jgi:hypothetical protein
MSDDKKTYNGWSNYETWNVALWIDNEPGTYEERRRLSRMARDKNELAESIKTWVRDEMAPDLGASMFADLLGAALSEVDWYELAENWWDDDHEPEEATD